jgi:GDP-L-fucose synthase
MNLNSTIYVTGHRGLLGSAICRALGAQGYTNVWTATHKQVNLANREDTAFFFSECKPDYVFHCAAKVGGIGDNMRAPADFLVDNLAIQSNVICAAHLTKVKKLLFLSSAACYPEHVSEPLRPLRLMTGPLDGTKSGYAMAKLCGMQMCREFRNQFGSDFISVIPNNIYGPGDKSSHVIPDLLRRFHEAKGRHLPEVSCWGTGNARREFIFADDLANACLFLMENYSSPEPINVGYNRDWTMRELAEYISEVVDYPGATVWDPSKPEGAFRRILDSSEINKLGWNAKTDLWDGLNATYKSMAQ